MNRLRRQIIENLAKKLPEEYREKIDRLEIPEMSDSGYDEFGFNKEYFKGMCALGMFFYKYWFRVEVHGLENVPGQGPALIVPNHSGQIPLDGLCIMMANLFEKAPPRLCRAMIEKVFPKMPFVSTLMPRVGQMTGLTENAERVLDSGQIMLVFPEGVKGSGKTWDKRYQLQRFTLGFMELSIKYKAPIIPCAVIGGEEQTPAFVDYKPIANALGLPYFPITPTFPWLGPLGLFPYPSKYHLYFGAPMDFSGREEDLSDPDLIRVHVEAVKDRIREMIKIGLDERPFPGL